MGSRGAFKDVNNNLFDFVVGGQRYQTIGWIDNAEIIIMPNNRNVKAPEFSHRANRIYVLLHRNKIKHISFYDDNHKQTKVIDFDHKHYDIIPHIHYNMDHNDIGIRITNEDKILINKIKKELGL